MKINPKRPKVCVNQLLLNKKKAVWTFFAAFSPLKPYHQMITGLKQKSIYLEGYRPTFYPYSDLFDILSAYCLRHLNTRTHTNMSSI